MAEDPFEEMNARFDELGRVNFGVNCAGHRGLGATIQLSMDRYD